MTDPINDAFEKLRKEAKLLVDVAKWGAFPDGDDDKEREYNLQSALDHAHMLVDLAHELRQAVRNA